MLTSNYPVKIKLNDIPEEGGKSISAREAEDLWFSDLLQASFGEHYQKGAAASLAVHLYKTCGNVQVGGGVEVDLTPPCDRCLEPFDRHLSVPVEVTLSPADEVATEGEEDEEVELTEDDLNFSFYEGDEIDLGDLIRQFLLLEVPIRHLCAEDCKGLCPHCGENLNHKKCDCRPARGDPRLAVLKNLPLRKS